MYSLLLVNFPFAIIFFDKLPVPDNVFLSDVTTAPPVSENVDGTSTSVTSTSGPISSSVITPVLPTCDPESNDIAVVAKSLISFVIDAFLVKDGIFVMDDVV